MLARRPRGALLALSLAVAALGGCPEERPEAEKQIPAERVPPALSLDPDPAPRRSPALRPLPAQPQPAPPGRDAIEPAPAAPAPPAGEPALAPAAPGAGEPAAP